MRTKSILLGAALLAAGAATSMAQVSNVFSVNVVGYVNLNLTNGGNLICNPLDAVGNGTATGNTVAAVLPNVPAGTQLFKYVNGAGYIVTDSYNFGAWGDGTESFNPGEGIFIIIPTVGQGGPAGGTNVTFVGTVVQGPTTHPIPNGANIIGSQAPLAGGIQSVLNYQPNGGDQLFYWSSAAQGYTTTYSYNFGSWGGPEPTNAVGQAVFIIAAGANTWTNTFKVQ